MERGNSDTEARAAWYLLEVARGFIWGGMSAYRRVDKGRRVGKDQTFTPYWVVSPKLCSPDINRVVTRTAQEHIKNVSTSEA